MPVVAADLGAVREYGFAFSVFMTAGLLGIVASGGWCDATGPAWPSRAGLVLFGGGLMISGVAESFAVLLLGRAMAGAGGGLLIVALYVAIAAVYPSAVQPRVFSYLSAGWVVPSIVGPALAGFLAENMTWRAVFLLVPPLTVPPALALVPKLRRIGPPGGDQRAPGAARPWPRVATGAGLAVGVGAVQWAADRLSREGGVDPGDAVTVSVIVAGIALAVVTLPRLVPPGTTRLARGLPTVIAMRGLYAGTFFGAESFIPLMLVTERGLSATAAGLILTGGVLGWTTGAVVQARPWMRLPRHLMLCAGGLVIAAGQAALVLAIRPPVPPWAAMPLWMITAFGMGLGMSSTSVLTLRLSRPGEEGRNSSGLQLSDQLGSAIGIGLTGAAFAAWHTPGDDADLFTGIWLACAAVSVLVGLAGLRARTASEAPALRG